MAARRGERSVFRFHRFLDELPAPAVQVVCDVLRCASRTQSAAALPLCAYCCSNVCARLDSAKVANQNRSLNGLSIKPPKEQIHYMRQLCILGLLVTLAAALAPLRSVPVRTAMSVIMGILLIPAAAAMLVISGIAGYFAKANSTR